MINKKKKPILAVLLASVILSILSACGGASGISEPQNTGENTQAQLLAISITPSDSSIAINTSQQLTATGIYSDNTTRDLTASVTWSTDDANIAAVGSDAVVYTSDASPGSAASALSYPGHIRGKACGKTTIKGRYRDVTGSTTVTVTNATLVTLALTPGNPSIAKGTSQQFSATGTFSDNTTQDLTTQVTWNSSNTADATISASGLATAVAAGSSTVSAAFGGVSGSTVLTVTPAVLVSLAVTPTNPGIAQGTTLQFAATGTYSDNTTQNLTSAVTWISANPAVATVTTSGLATAVASGTASITATAGSISASTVLTVTPAVLVSLAVTPTNTSIAKGTTQQFRATGTFSDNTTQDLTASVAWSSDSGAATISNAAGSQGLATATAAGTATITAASKGISGSTTLTVTPAILVSIAVTPASPSIAKGTKQQFTATGTYSDGAMQNITTAVTWSSSNTGVATVSNAAGSNGLATSVAAGSTTITAASGSVAGSASLTVTPATLVSITVSPANPTIVKGTRQQFAATGRYSDNSTQNLTSAVTWSSSNTGVATISNAAGSNGLATSVAAGSTTITAASGSVSGSTTLSVTAATLTSIAVTPANPSIAQGDAQQFSATGTYSDGTTQNLTAAVTWASSNAGIATISNATGSKGLATAVVAGTTSITATLGGVTGSASLTVTSAVTGSATLAWNAPITNTDGTSAIAAGYKIYYGTSPGNYTRILDIGNVTTYTVSNLSAGTYYFTVTAYDAGRIESSFSNEASKTIQ